MDLSRISFRPFTLSDLDDFFAWASDERVTRYLEMLTMASKKEALRHLEELVLPHPFRHSICLDDRSVGFISLTPQTDRHKTTARISIGLAFEHWGKGIAMLAVKYAIKKGFADFEELVRIEALVEEECVGSQKVFEKVGFRKEGLMRKWVFNKGNIRDTYVFSFLSTDTISDF